MIKVYVSNGKPLVWNANDACTLRESHRIIGTLVGGLARLPRQNIHLGLPLELMAVEATLLQEMGVIKLLDDSGQAELPTEGEVTEFKEQREELYQRQVALCREESLRQKQRKLPEILAGRRRKKKRRLLAQHHGDPTSQLQPSGDVASQSQHSEDSASQSEDEEVIEQITAPPPPLPEKHACVQIHTACVRSKQYPPAEWDFPCTEMDKLRFTVFKDLYNKGHWLTAGGKFGGDFLVYPGDPGRFHSFYIAICVPYHKDLAVQDVMTFSRLGANVKKTIVLSSVDNDGALKYTSLQWTGIK